MCTDNNKINEHVDELRITWSAGQYYEAAEAGMDRQWRKMIYPRIKEFDFSRVLELSPGHGRNTEKLKELSGAIYLVDVNEPCIAACRKRFADYQGPCKLHFHVNDGVSFPMVASGIITLVYSWDAMVHFHTSVCRRYIDEFARVMRPGGHGFVHHSNYGAFARDQDTNWMDGPHWRSTMSSALFAQYAADAGLTILSQTLLTWSGVENLDCISVFQKPVSTRAEP